jgi:hypothetical protein
MPPATTEFPVKVDISKDIYRPFPEIDQVDKVAEGAKDAFGTASAALASLSSALQAGDAAAVQSCFLSSQCFWRDSVSLTYHFRTFLDAAVGLNLVVRAKLHGAKDFKPVPGVAMATNAGPKKVGSEIQTWSEST